MCKLKMVTKAKLSYVQMILKPCLGPVPKQLLCTFSHLESIHAQDTFPDLTLLNNVRSAQSKRILLKLFHEFWFVRYRKDVNVEFDAFEIKYYFKMYTS